MKYAQIIKGVVNLIEIDPKKVQKLIDSGLEIIDISKMKIKPGQGWTYKDKKFSKPEKEKKYNKSKSGFFGKLSGVEIRSIQDIAKSDDDINAWLFRLSFGTKINEQESLDLLVSKSIIDQARADDILKG